MGSGEFFEALIAQGTVGFVQSVAVCRLKPAGRPEVHSQLTVLIVSVARSPDRKLGTVGSGCCTARPRPLSF
jgi:hypothetical protein